MADPAAPYWTAAALKAERSSLATVPDDVLERRIRQFEDIVERARGVAYTPRDRTAVARRWRWSWVRLPNVQVRQIYGVTVDLIGATSTGLSLFEDRLGDLLEAGTDWSVGTVRVAYEHGLDEPPEVILEACAEYVAAVTEARASGTSRNVITQAFDGGSTRYATPDWDKGNYTGFLEVDRLINSARDYRPVGLG